MSEVALLVAVVSLLGTLTTVVRLFTKTEVGVATLEKTLAKVEAQAQRTADEFNGPSRNAHTELTGRVATLERDTQRLATIESVASVRTEVAMGFSEIKTMLARIEKDMEATR
jgi:hypothetical protein